VQSFRCLHCGEIAAEFRQGRELEIEAIELEDPEPSGENPEPVKEQV
jgi:hypothetical protein